MAGFFDAGEWSAVVDRALSDVVRRAADFVPDLLSALLILLLGWVVARCSEWLVRRLLRALGVDRLAGRLGVSETLQRADVSLSFSQVSARVVFWLVMLAFVLSSVETLGLSPVSDAIDRLLAFVPNIVAACLIGLGGLVLGRFAATVISSGAAAARFAGARRLAPLSQTMVGAVALVLAIEQLGVDMQVLLLPLTVLLGAAGLAIGLSFALGARPIVTHILAGHFLQQSLPRDRPVEVDGRRGVVERVGALDTVLRSEEGETWSVPNAQLIERVVGR